MFCLHIDNFIPDLFPNVTSEIFPNKINGKIVSEIRVNDN